MAPKREISNLEDLLYLLDNSSKEEYKSFGKDIVIPLEEFIDYIHFNEDFYTRNCIKRTDDYELILLCWEKGQSTPIHCHNDQECWVHVLMGEFEEKRFVEKKGNMIQDHQLNLEKEKISYMNDDMGYHSLENMAKGRSVSLHLYMEPIEECKVYNEVTQEFEMRELEYYSYAGELEEVG